MPSVPQPTTVHFTTMKQAIIDGIEVPAETPVGTITVPDGVTIDWLVDAIRYGNIVANSSSGNNQSTDD